MIGIINFGLGNIGSIKNAIEKINEPYFLINKIEDFSKAKKLILPGVGSFKIGMKNLINKGFDRMIKKVVNEDKKPILGICLGMQLLALRGYEDGKNEGLNLIGGEVKILKKKLKFSLPHIGWNNVTILKKNKILNGIPNEKNFYFVHSYHFLPEKKEDIIAKTNYSEDINAIVASKNIYGIQAHPEKSQYYGLKLLKNFCRFC